MRQYHVYMLASLSRVLYTGVSNDLRRRIGEHKSGAHPGFTRDYRVTNLVYFETTTDVRAAIAREKQLKRWPRWRKVRLIEAHNMEWRDLSLDWAQKIFAEPGHGRGTVDPDTRSLRSLLRDDK